MRSRIVPMREMGMFGAEVQRFRYAFVLPRHAEGWNARHADKGRNEGAVEPEAPEILPHPRRRASDRQPTFIDVKPK